ncbi:MAG TPA: hypothetical protein VMU19_14355 [Bryobacteraceae bacterium]|nr:hypothetical protein [Bryobacteraceae bacterium]
MAVTPPKRSAARVVKRIAPYALALGVGIYFLSSLFTGKLTKSGANPLVIIGQHDQIYTSHGATADDAKALGMALRGVGFFNDRGAQVILSKGEGGTVVSFASKDGSWDHRETVLAFEEIGRRIAPALGGFPITVRMMDQTKKTRREIVVGKIGIFGKDEVYYLGSAKPAEAVAMGRVLIAGLYLNGAGASVLLSKEAGPGMGTTISFVVYGDTWKKPEAGPAFEGGVRKVAPVVGGLPITLRLVDTNMATLKEEVVN